MITMSEMSETTGMTEMIMIINDYNDVSDIWFDQHLPTSVIHKWDFFLCITHKIWKSHHHPLRTIILD